ncbi:MULTISPECIES: histidine kinase [Marinobacter]|jgi:two-component system nitrate/nitrite sensor histidine kinase NarX|uniref:Sensor protein n=1 Tax=Marinobacter nauticus TaxID=2743 RepID=A0A833JSD2_MARNT|nr:MULTISPECIES: histidine kinase [Marinobacter]MAL31996.1 histidine kinase [Marinobacter sp.]MEC9386817.1 histidine kinase [Pseudomonadota bacterium]KAE8545666.1 Nitrate/nitrite sensor protein NarQ [Marinobacter nauticus]MBW3197132.1 HAMP domain-containing protein [Marinobacter nauticus]MBY6182542.1 HAMP domain-containing protein [Marinobacter nauticus]|tara:strand:- start:1103 stop:2959 length:1857 start_codon:yes stop_codon:yes gene_type:complete
MTSRSPLVNRLAVVIGAIVLTAIVSMATTLAVSNSIEGNATAINLAGSLRMGAFQLAARSASEDPVENTDTLDQRIEEYEDRLRDPAIIRSIPRTDDHPLVEQYKTVEYGWANQLRPSLESHQTGAPLSAEMITTVESYTVEVDRLVSMLEQRTEARIDLLHLIQIISMVFSVLIVLALFLDLKNRILRPLRKLVGIATAVGEQDFSHKADLKGSDELAQLGQAFDQMTSELALTYYELESRARQKTEELEISHAALQVMHSASRGLFANHDLCSGAIPMLQDLEQLLGIGPIRLFLHDKESAEPVEAITTATPKRPFYCRDHHCNACLVTPEVYDEMPLENNDGRRLLLPIRTPGQLLGTLEVWYPAEKGLPETSRRLLETLTDQLATAIFLEKQITEEQQLTLAEERTVIARELHDSLAQSLSYLKMQVTRLRRLNIDGEQKPIHDDILDELSTGLNSAYRQLRELLATFRLKLDTPDLATALRKTIDEFSERLGKPVAFEYNLPPQTLSPNEEIHTLQIIREGLANAVKHADATDIAVKVVFDSPQVRASIQDNGRGLPGGDQPVNHYGLIIMQDRARTLGGKVNVRNRDEGGVEVALTFVPKSRNLIPTETTPA